MGTPSRTREYHSHHFNSSNWDQANFTPRDDDIFVCTAYKSGTTWMQTIVSQLLFADNPPGVVGDISPWVDLRVPPAEVKMPAIEAMTHRRFLKTHLPLTAMPYWEKPKYIYVGRDGRDAFMSLLNHYFEANDLLYDALNRAPGLVGPPFPEARDTFTPQIFDKWLSEGWETHPWEEDGWPWWSYFSNLESWWEFRHLPNILFVHFNNLKKDLPGEMRKVAKFLDIPIDESKFPTQVEHCSFDYMKAHSEDVAPLKGMFWEGRGKTFIYKGSNGRWADALTADQIARYEAYAEKKLCKEAAHWAATGEHI